MANASLFRSAALLTATLVSASAYCEGQDNPAPQRTIITLQSTIVGDKEQPKVLSIVPWQKPEHQVVKTTQVARQIEIKFKPIEAESLNRELKYYQQSRAGQK